MNPDSRRCSRCGGIEFWNARSENWQCERCGKISSRNGKILVESHYSGVI